MKVVWNVYALTFCCNVVSCRSWQQAQHVSSCDFISLDVTEHTARLLSGISYSSSPIFVRTLICFRCSLFNALYYLQDTAGLNWN